MKTQSKKNYLQIALWSLTVVLGLGVVFTLAVFPELKWLNTSVALCLLVVLGTLVSQNRKGFAKRTVAYGAYSLLVTLLALSIIGVLNFLSFKHQGKIDLTQDKLHTLSEQTEKLVKGLKTPARAVLFAKFAEREQKKGVLESYRNFNPEKFEIEHVDPDKEPARAKAAGVKKYGTLQLVVGGRDSKLEEITEEKLTNALIKLTQTTTPVLCAVTGHGEKNFNGADAEGYEAMKKGLIQQSYELKELNLISEGKVPTNCSALAILGPTKAFFPQEISLIKQYLADGGRALFALDVDTQGGQYAPELNALLSEWHVKATQAMVVDPFSKLLNIDPSVAILATFSKENPITQDFQGNAYFPFMRPLEIIPNAPAGLEVQWLAQSTPKSWAEGNFKEITSGKVKMDKEDKQGPLTGVIAVSGKLKDSKATKNTRIVVFGSSYFATNNFSRLAANSDFFLNSVSWVMEDESVISIRSKEGAPGKVEITQKAGTSIFLLTVIVVPLLVAIAGIVIWVFRRKL